MPESHHLCSVQFSSVQSAQFGWRLQLPRFRVGTREGEFSADLRTLGKKRRPNLPAEAATADELDAGDAEVLLIAAVPASVVLDELRDPAEWHRLWLATRAHMATINQGDQIDIPFRRTDMAHPLCA